MPFFGRFTFKIVHVILYKIGKIERGKNMFFSNADIINYNNEKYVIVAVHKRKDDGRVFALSCLLSYDNEPTDNFSVFWGKVEEPHLVLDSDLINKLMPEFQKQLKDNVQELF